MPFPWSRYRCYSSFRAVTSYPGIVTSPCLVQLACSEMQAKRLTFAVNMWDLAGAKTADDIAFQDCWEHDRLYKAAAR